VGQPEPQGDPPFRAAAIFLRGEDSHRPFRSARRGQYRRAAPPRGIVQNLYYRWSKEFLEAGKKRLAGDTAHDLIASLAFIVTTEADAFKDNTTAPNQPWQPGFTRGPGVSDLVQLAVLSCRFYGVVPE
jgi:hypothetical protein